MRGLGSRSRCVTFRAARPGKIGGDGTASLVDERRWIGEQRFPAGGAVVLHPVARSRSANNSPIYLGWLLNGTLGRASWPGPLFRVCPVSWPLYGPLRESTPAWGGDHQCGLRVLRRARARPSSAIVLARPVWRISSRARCATGFPPSAIAVANLSSPLFVFNLPFPIVVARGRRSSGTPRAGSRPRPDQRQGLPWSNDERALAHSSPTIAPPR